MKAISFILLLFGLLLAHQSIADNYFEGIDVFSDMDFSARYFERSHKNVYRLNVNFFDKKDVTGILIGDKTWELKGSVEQNKINLFSAGNDLHFSGTITYEGKNISALHGSLNTNQKEQYVFFVDLPMVTYSQEPEVACESRSKYPFSVRYPSDDNIRKALRGIERNYTRENPTPTDNLVACPSDLYELDFLKPLINITTQNFNPSDISYFNNRLDRYCGAYALYAGERHRQFKLNQLGYFPKRFLTNGKFDEGNQLFMKTAPSEDLLRGLEYWSYESYYNREKYLEYFNSIEQSREELTQWFISKRGLNQDNARDASQYALNILTNSGNFGLLGHASNYGLSYDIVNMIQQNDPNWVNAKDLTESYRYYEHQRVAFLNIAIMENSDIDTINKFLDTWSSFSISQLRETPLSNATMRNDVLKLLLDRGFDPNHKNYFGKTPLYYAIQYNQPESVKILLNHNAVINDQYAPREIKSGESIEYIKDECASNIKHWFRTPLMHAAQHSDVEMLKLLIEHGADPMMRDSTDETAYDYAVRTGNPENAAYLRSIMPASAFPESTTTTTAMTSTTTATAN